MAVMIHPCTYSKAVSRNTQKPKQCKMTIRNPSTSEKTYLITLEKMSNLLIGGFWSGQKDQVQRFIRIHLAQVHGIHQYKDSRDGSLYRHLLVLPRNSCVANIWWRKVRTMKPFTTLISYGPALRDSNTSMKVVNFQMWLNASNIQVKPCSCPEHGGTQ